MTTAGRKPDEENAMNPIELTPSVAPPCRPVIVSTPLAGEVAIALPVQAAGVVYLAQLAWHRGDLLETTDVLLDPEPADGQTLLVGLLTRQVTFLGSPCSLLATCNTTPGPPGHTLDIPTDRIVTPLQER